MTTRRHLSASDRGLGDVDVAEVIPHRDLADDQLADADMDWPEALATVTAPCYS